MSNADLLKPISSLNLGINTNQLRQLKSHGIVVLSQLVEQLQGKPAQLVKWGLQPEALLARCYDTFPRLKKSAFEQTAPFVAPALGIVLDPKDSPIIMQRRADTQQERLSLAKHCRTLEPSLPADYLDLVKDMTPVRDQQQLGSCTGFGSTAAHEYLTPKLLSPGYTYRGSKTLDGRPDLQGSWQEFCYEFFCKTGAVLESDYTYDDCLNEVDIAPWKMKAKRFQLDNYLDLMVEPQERAVVLKAALCGALSPQLSPRPVSISVALLESFYNNSASRFGLISLPFEGEKLEGGHAMVAVGYTQRYDTTYFVVQNSWGTRWAQENPLALPGYCLIPEDYFSTIHDVDGYGMSLVSEMLTPM